MLCCCTWLSNFCLLLSQPSIVHFLLHKHTWAHADVHPASGRVHWMLVLTWYLLHYQCRMQMEPACLRSLLFLLTFISSAAKSCFIIENWLQGSWIMCFEFSVLRKRFLAIFYKKERKKEKNHPDFKVMFEGFDESGAFHSWLHNKAAKETQFLIPLQYLHDLPLHYSCWYLSLSR